MAVKATYLYKVDMGWGETVDKTSYCYARNAGVAIDTYKEMYREKKYDSFRAKMFGEAKIEAHPGLFELMEPDEIEYIESKNLASAPAYSQRKNTAPAKGQFMTKEELEKII